MEHYGERLVSLALFGSAGRGTMRPDSDLDFLVVASPLPNGRMRRVEDFAPVESVLEPELRTKQSRGVYTYLSPIFKTPEEIVATSPILLDMTEDVRVLFDREGFLGRQLADLRARLRKLGARRVFSGDGWWWDLKPDFKDGEVFSI
jgi:hypothetical protein